MKKLDAKKIEKLKRKQERGGADEPDEIGAGDVLLHFLGQLYFEFGIESEHGPLLQLVSDC